MKDFIIKCSLVAFIASCQDHSIDDPDVNDARKKVINNSQRRFLRILVPRYKG